MIKKIAVALISFCGGVNFAWSTTASPDNQAWNVLLQKYVVQEQVDFTGLCKDPELPKYIDEVSRTHLDALTAKDEQLAFWLNAYSAYTLKVICDKYPVKSMVQLGSGSLIVSALLSKTVWDKPVVSVDGQKYTLKAVDHEVIRGKYKDPRLQFGMYCGAVSCPPLRNEAYDASRLSAQLQDQAKAFFNNPKINSFDLKTKHALLSPIMNWNARYFGGTRDNVLKFISGFVPKDIGDSLNAEPANWSVKYGSYDLTINDLHRN
jgi:hypothetical protein